MREWVVVPAYNEAENIVDVINDIRKYTNNVVVVDDGSKDNTAQRLEKLGVNVIKHKINLGKGAALKTGCDYALRQGAGKITVIDSDGQHEPKDLPRFWQALEHKDIIFSYRQKYKDMPMVLKFGNNFINNVIALLFGVRVKDSQCGYRAFTADAYKKIRWKATDYYMETEMIINTGKNKLNYGQLPIKTIYADKYKGTTVLDGVKIVMKILGRRLVP